MTDDLVTRAKTLSAMINLGERIAWGQDTAMIDELAARIEADAATIARLEGTLNLRDAGWAAEHARAEAAEAKVAALVGELASIANDLSCTDARGRKYADRIIEAIAAAKGGA